jgi:hypothetical protein
MIIRSGRSADFPSLCRNFALLAALLMLAGPGCSAVRAQSTGGTNIVISQVYTRGGEVGAIYQNDFIELYNRGNTAVDIYGWTLSVQAFDGTSTSNIQIRFSTPRPPIPVGGHFLLQFPGNGTNGQPLSPDISVDSVSLGATGGEIMLLGKDQTPPSGCPAAPDPTGAVIDYVGYGSATCAEGTATLAPSATTALLRKGGGCTDTDNNANDFVIGPPNPRNNSSPLNPCASNPIDQPDFFVKQHYLDFLNRQADQSGLDFWTQQITSCGSDAQCIDVRRINVSAAFFLSIEFQQTGNLVYKMYKAGFGNLSGKPVAADRTPFLADTRQIQSTPTQVVVGQGDWQAQLEANKQAFALAFVQRSQFQAMYVSMPASNYVQTLFTNTGVTPTAGETSAAINAFNSAGGGDAGRAAALRSVAESNSVSTSLFNEAFVLMQYFGYLQRNPNDPPDSDYSGYTFWLNKLNSFNGDYIAAEMVKAFITSAEYRNRFGP